MKTKTKDSTVKAMPKITETIKQSAKNVFTYVEMRELLNTNRQLWRLGECTLQQFIQTMTTGSHLKAVNLEFPYRPAHRYVWGEANTFELVQSINPQGYFSHYAALQLHQLTEQIPKTIYLNIEQAKKPGGGILSQVGIDRAFHGKCRTSTNFARYKDRTICLLNGANTGQLGVIQREAPQTSIQIRLTNIERTLIDATVRPIYTGGVFEVAKAFEIAREHVSSNKIAAYLRTLNYAYPYHQSIGFYMERAKYKPAQLAFMKEFSMDFDFYLDYGTKDLEYAKEWKLYVPKGF